MLIGSANPVDLDCPEHIVDFGVHSDHDHEKFIAAPAIDQKTTVDFRAPLLYPLSVVSCRFFRGFSAE
ncbi:MAG: hypothetical protein LC730_03890 [Acidobacteria bacterium]|nr:hypothetical protein [Acidobacteriota bacterium]MCA1608588.1 hypothetical protein [Acidobacteriota bacterium]